MGLDSFKTEGPRTYTKDKGDSSDVSADVVHKLKGTDPDTSMIPSSARVHSMTCREMFVGLQSTETHDVYVCSKCDFVSTSFESALKVDKLEFKDSDWYDKYFDNAVSAADEVDRKETLDDISLKERKEADVNDESDDKVKPSSGLDAFKT